MSLFYSATVGGFLDDRVHRDIPTDAVAVTADQHARLLSGQQQGRPIAANENGRPYNAAPERPSADQLRDRLLAAVKAEAARRILLVAPIWRQLNDTRDLPLASGEQRAAIEARLAAIDAIRRASGALEQRIASATARALAQIDITAASHWPS